MESAMTRKGNLKTTRLGDTVDRHVVAQHMISLTLTYNSDLTRGHDACLRTSEEQACNDPISIQIIQ
jgi:hypothetical protein